MGRKAVGGLAEFVKNHIISFVRGRGDGKTKKEIQRIKTLNFFPLPRILVQ